MTKADELGSDPVVQIAGPFFRGSGVLTDGTEAAEARGMESSAGNLIANAARESSTKYLAQKADIGIINAGGIRSDLVPSADGWLSEGDLFTAQPFGNSMAYVTLSGAQVKRALEEQWQPEGSSRPMLKLGLSDNVTYGFDAFTDAGAIDTGFIDLDAFRAYLTGLDTAADPLDLRDGAVGIDNSPELEGTFVASEDRLGTAGHGCRHLHSPHGRERGANRSRSVTSMG